MVINTRDLAFNYTTCPSTHRFITPPCVAREASGATDRGKNGSMPGPRKHERSWAKANKEGLRLKAGKYVGAVDRTVCG